MGVALVGFIGVATGAIVTGWVTATLRWLDRRLSGRVAARVLDAALLAASLRIGAILSSRELGHPSEDWVELMIKPWQDHRDNLARVVKDRDDFGKVANAFSMVLSAISLRTMLFETGGVEKDSKAEQNTTEMLVALRATLDSTRSILRDASLSFPQRVKAKLSRDPSRVGVGVPSGTEGNAPAQIGEMPL